MTEAPTDLDARVAALFAAQADQARRYAELLSTSAVEWGLIGPREADKIWDRHILNCAVLASAIPAGVRLADVGSGAGLPGVVLAIARPDIRVTLIEPLLRRVTWLTTAVTELDLPNVTITRSRAEALPAAERSFDVVTARAVAALPKLLGWCVPLLKPGGIFLGMKGATIADELAESEPTLAALGAASWTVEEYGAGTVDPPTRVVRVVAGTTRPAPAKPASSAKPARTKPRRRR